MCIVHVGFRAAHEGSAELHRAGAEHESRCCGTTVGDTAGRDDRDADSVNDLG